MKKTIFLIALLLFMLPACDVPDLPATAIESSNAPLVPDSTLSRMTVVYVGEEGYIWKWEEGAYTRLEVTDNAQGVQISSDGRWIAYVRGGELFVFDLQNPTAHHNKPRMDFGYLMNLNPNAIELPRINDFYFITYHDDDGVLHHDIIVNVLVTSGTGGMDVFRVSADDDNSLPSRLFAPGEGGRISPSPDGRWLIVSMANELLLTRSRGFDLETRSLFDDFPAYLCLGARGGPDIVWEEDSTGFYVVTPHYDPDSGTLFGESTLWRVSVPDGQRSPVFHYMAQLFQPAYISPRSRQVIYLIDYGDMVSMMYAQDEGVEVLMTYQRDSAGFIGWAPAPRGGADDSSCYVYWQNEREWPFMACIGQPIYQLTENSIFRHDLLRWVDENRFLYVNGLEPDYTLYLDHRNSDIPSQLISRVHVDPHLPPYDFTFIP